MVYPALLPLMSTPRLPVVDWTDVPCRFKWTRPPLRRKTKSGFCACSITFQTQSTKIGDVNRDDAWGGKHSHQRNVKMWWMVPDILFWQRKRYTPLFSRRNSPPVGQGLLIIEASRSHSSTQHSIRFLSTNDRLEAQTSTWQHTVLTRKTSKPLAGFEPAIPVSDRPQTARPLWLAR
jgi:hypothetical protein